MQGDCLDQAALDTGVDIECVRCQDRPVAGVQNRMNLAQGNALNRNGDLYEYARFTGQIGQAVETTNLTSMTRLILAC